MMSRAWFHDAYRLLPTISVRQILISPRARTQQRRILPSGVAGFSAASGMTPSARAGRTERDVSTTSIVGERRTSTLVERTESLVTRDGRYQLDETPFALRFFWRFDLHQINENDALPSSLVADRTSDCRVF